MSDEEIRKALEHVRAEFGSGYGWGAWTREEYEMAERVLMVVKQRLGVDSITERLPKAQKTL